MSPEALMAITAWMSSTPELLDEALPKISTVTRIQRDETVTDRDQAIGEARHAYQVMRDLALISATAITCWATTLGIDPTLLMQDIALGIAETQALVPDSES